MTEKDLVVGNLYKVICTKILHKHESELSILVRVSKGDVLLFLGFDYDVKGKKYFKWLYGDGGLYHIY